MEFAELMESMGPFIAYTVALGVAAVIPGPGVAAVVGHSLGSHSRSVLPFIAGMVFGDIVFLTVAVLGLSLVAQLFAGVFLAIKIAGGCYLLYLAWSFWTTNVEATDVASVSERKPWISAMSGLAVTFGNPKAIVFYLALLPNVIDLATVTLLDWAFLSLLTAAVLLAVLLPYSIAAAQLRGVLAKPRALRRLNRGAALMIGGAGSLIIADAARTHD